MVKIHFYVPVSHVEAVKQAMFDAGAGRIGQYEHCAWQVLGRGQFRPLAGSRPFIGDQGSLSRVDEYSVEMVCEDGCLRGVIKALKSSHPYEEPAYGVFPMLEVK